MTKNIVFLMTLLVGVLFTSNSCTDLDEIILDETSATGLSDKQAADGNLAPVYAVLPTLFQHTTYFALQEISTDEAILPYRGGTDWGDNGIYLALHTHTITSADPNVRNTWTTILTGISRSVTAMNALATNPDPVAKTYLAEARGMRAYYNLLLLDLFGLAFIKNDLGEISTIMRGSEAVNFLRDELLAVEPDLLTTVGPGRLSKAGAWGLLARLHLNAAVYRDPYAATFDFKAEDMDKVIEYADKIIGAGQHQLVADYFAIFNTDNHTNKELVFAVDQRAELNGHNRLAYFSLSGDQFPLAPFPAANGTDGPAITPDFYRTWVDAYAPTDPADIDPRFHRQNWTIPADSCVDGATFNMNRGILRGQQYGFLRVNGAFVKCADGKLKVGKLYSASRNKPTLAVNFTEKVDFTVAGSDYSSGYRVLKYEFSKKSASGRNLGDVDIPIVRLADVYLMRAEAKLRKSNDAAGALADVNAIRAARTFSKPAPALTSMNLDLLFRERGFELYWEMLRRSDMIRFGKYEGIWTEKNNTDKSKRLFPIPQTAIDGASNIPGYLKQNQSY
ncbi:RagB/SusD family nutrient uptake outer membrane protein [Haliscomenobacter hydrossis]|uniref:RagB/SusD domain-containing protein n=1 Tax=Haliscomenobacter hydrossis (strain ATCC 27775 / DSM 1100 / LMG 10767 / O) TaxID=760192 RepID=F4KVK7_HALH1|nr:RagB/SusD family nutrient uptake outer membrane protein [Haliscomenobacter hydrossis]AEE52464.1 RagB/SusD domain-containing protein [Haliscomenobacter hydrossis DSM 1100]